jgi:prepilin-type N-terminal cleavage/methylation domain-containing protein
MVMNSLSERAGFTLIELMVVLLIIIMLSSFALFSYDRYKEKARAKELITLARGCSVDVVAECLLRKKEMTDPLDKAVFQNCGNRTLEGLGTVELTLSGCCTDFEVEAVGSKIEHYKGKCTGDYRERIECNIEDR